MSICLRLLLLLAPLWALGGCTRYIARQIEQPDRDRGPLGAQLETWMHHDGFQLSDFQTNQGVRLAYWYARPMALDIDYKVTEHRHGQHGSGNLHFNFKRSKHRQPAKTPKGSVILLHAWSEQGASMINWGVDFANAGYVTVMPDLRDQGHSGTAPIGYGPREAGDISALIQHLRAKHELPGPLYLLGVSYGATTALFTAARAPHLRAVIAMEPYIDAGDVIRRVPKSGLFGHAWLFSLISTREMGKAIARASKDLGVDLNHVDVEHVVTDIHACTLLMRGDHDTLISAHAMRKLASHSARIGFVSIPGEGHLTLPFRSDLLFQPLLDWMQAAPASNQAPCPAYPHGIAGPGKPG